MVNGLSVALGLWSGLRLRGVVNGLGLSLALWFGLRLRVLDCALGYAQD